MGFSRRKEAEEGVKVGRGRFGGDDGSSRKGQVGKLINYIFGLCRLKMIKLRKKTKKTNLPL